jgi:hypothetical protein
MANSQDKQVGSIYRTTYYEKYKFNNFNRVIKEPHVRNLMEKMKLHGFLSNKAISVNEKMEIIDGHHRFLAARNLNIPILVQVCKGMKEDSILETNQDQVNWDKHDYTNYWAKRGNENYIALRDFMVKYPKFKITQSLILLSNEPNAHPKTDIFQKGNFKIKSVRKAEEYARQIIEVSTIFPKAFQSKFISAIIACDLRSQDFVFTEFIEKLKKFPDKLTPSITTKAYLEKFEDLYNYHRPKKHFVKLADIIRDIEK